MFRWQRLAEGVQIPEPEPNTFLKLVVGNKTIVEYFPTNKPQLHQQKY